MLNLRAVLVGLIVLATVGFVVGTSIERHNRARESPAHVNAEGGGGESAAHVEGGGSPAHTKAEGGVGERPASRAEESRLLGVDIEAVPIVVLASVGSLALAGLAWVRPRWLVGLAIVVAAMTAFGALDVREVFHQSDEGHRGLAVLAAVIAVLHFGALSVAGLMARGRGAATMPP